MIRPTTLIPVLALSLLAALVTSLLLATGRAAYLRWERLAAGEFFSGSVVVEHFLIRSDDRPPVGYNIIRRRQVLWGEWRGECFLGPSPLPVSWTADVNADLLLPALPEWLPLAKAGTPRVESEAFGWPWPALFIATDSAAAIDTGLAPQGVPKNLTLPRRVAWRGLAGNTLVLAPGFVAVWVFAIPLRKAMRRRRGLCGVCRYDLRGLPHGTRCPECGSAAGPTTGHI